MNTLLPENILSPILNQYLKKTHISIRDYSVLEPELNFALNELKDITLPMLSANDEYIIDEKVNFNRVIQLKSNRIIRLQIKLYNKINQSDTKVF